MMLLVEWQEGHLVCKSHISNPQRFLLEDMCTRVVSAAASKTVCDIVAFKEPFSELWLYIYL